MIICRLTDPYGCEGPTSLIFAGILQRLKRFSGVLVKPAATHEEDSWLVEPPSYLTYDVVLWFDRIPQDCYDRLSRYRVLQMNEELLWRLLPL